MNERIKELAEQAYKEFVSECSYTYIDPIFPALRDKFAELIVRECMSVSEDVANADGKGPWFEGHISGVEEVNRRIKQHFGVEE